LNEHNWWLIIGSHWKKIAGGLVGLIFALLVLNYGFWSSLFILFCIALGLFIGWRLEVNQNISKYLNNLFSSKSE